MSMAVEPLVCGPLDLVPADGLGDSRSSVVHHVIDFLGPDADGAENGCTPDRAGRVVQGWRIRSIPR